MTTIRALVVGLVVPVLILSLFVVSTALARGPMDKETICHFAQHKYVEITVNGNALPAHMAHGDVMTDEYGDCP